MYFISPFILHCATEKLKGKLTCPHAPTTYYPMTYDRSRSSRQQAREIALQILFQREFAPEVNIETSLDYFTSMIQADSESRKYAGLLLHGVIEKISELDQRISDRSKNWSLDRMSPVDRSILRIGCYELCFTEADVPKKVAINEAIELAKRYSGTDSSSFVNGILDEIQKNEVI